MSETARKLRREPFLGTNSACPEYQNLFNGHYTSRNKLIEENPNMVLALDRIVQDKQLYGQMTLEGDILYPPIKLNGYINSEAGMVEMTEGFDYSIFQQ